MCARVLSSVDTTDASARPPTALPHGVVYRNVEAPGSTGVDPAVTSAWEMIVPARDSERDTVVGAVLDVDEDGRTDVAVSQLGVVTGGAFGLIRGVNAPRGSYDLVRASAARGWSPVGTSLAAAGDVNGDGFGDVVSGTAPGTFGAAGVIPSSRIYLGTPTGTPTAIVLRADTASVSPGTSLAGVGDIDGDGFADVVAGLPRARMDAGDVLVYRGGRTFASTTPITVPVGLSIGGVSGDNAGDTVALADFDGDGFADLFAGAPDAGFDYAGVVWAFRGSATGLTPPATVRFTAGLEAGFGARLASGW